MRNLVLWGLLLCSGVAWADPLAGEVVLGLINARMGAQESSPHLKAAGMLWQVKNGFYPTSVVWSPDGKYVADGGTHSPHVDIWDVAGKKVVKDIDIRQYGTGQDGVDYSNMAWSPNGKYLALPVARNKQMLVFDTESWRVVKEMISRDSLGGSGSPSFSSDSSLLAMVRRGRDSKGEDSAKMIQVYSTRDWQRVALADFADTDHVPGWSFDTKYVAFRPGTHELAMDVDGFFGFLPGQVQNMDVSRGPASTPRNGSVILFWDFEHEPPPDLRAGGLEKGLFTQYAIEAMAYSPDGRVIATGTLTGGGVPGKTDLESVHFYDAATRQLLAAPLDGHDHGGQTMALAWLDHGKYFVVGHYDQSGTLDVIETETYKVVEVLHAHGMVGSMSATPDGMKLAVTADAHVELWDFVDPGQ